MVAFQPDAIVARVSRSRKLEGIVLWTKDPRNLIANSGLYKIITALPSIVQLTVTGLGGSAWEPGVPMLEEFLPAVETLGRILPSGAVRWRFDPIIPTPDLQERFASIAGSLAEALGSLDDVTVSFADPYRKALARTIASGLAWPRLNLETQKAILRDFSTTMQTIPTASRSASEAPRLRLCCEPALLSLPGVGQACCIDDKLFKQLYGLDLGGLGKDRGQRQACGCVQSTDIGSYEYPCLHRCRYCYANPDL